MAINLPAVASVCSVCSPSCVWGISGTGVASARGGLFGIPVEEGGPAVAPADGRGSASEVPCNPSNEKKNIVYSQCL